jgi:hypothetical protein
MKKLFLLLSALPLFVHAQDSTRCLKPWSVEIQTGMNVYTDLPFNIEDMKKIAPASQFAQRDFSDYTSNGPYYGMGYSLSTTAHVGIMAEFVPYNKKKKDYKWYSTIRAGVSYDKIYLQGPSYWKSDRMHIDTISPVSGTTIYNDSVSNKNYAFQWVGESIGIDLSQVFHTNERRNFSIGVGYGVHLGMGVNTFLRAMYSEDNYIETTTITPPATYSTIESSNKYFGQTENIRTKNVFISRIYFPVTIQIRLSKKKNVFNKIALTSESRGSIDLQPVPGLGVLTRFYFNQSFGLKYYIEYNPMK